LRVANELSLGTLEIGTSRSNLSLEEISRICSRFIAALEVRAKESIGDAIDHVGR
jgi:hypothetical protein